MSASVRNRTRTNEEEDPEHHLWKAKLLASLNDMGRQRAENPAHHVPASARSNEVQDLCRAL